jgi:hypothetical protein
MKKEITKWITSIEDIAMEEAVNEFFDGDWEPTSWEDTESCIDSYIEEFSEIEDEEENLLRQEIKKEFDKMVNNLREEESVQLKDRKSILNWIDSSFDNWPDEGEVGYLLSKEKILDLILQNGNK